VLDGAGGSLPSWASIAFKRVVAALVAVVVVDVDADDLPLVGPRHADAEVRQLGSLAPLD
jgi:hypothetical protein